ncbi:MAG: hypothetical protein HYY05_06160 [Chloroflexi bacterium]|nr:hypothetical protein [Chloroflexota bacterium]
MLEPARGDELVLLLEVAGLLDSARISYMVTGSMALNYYAMPRMTRDLDIVIDLRPAEAARLEELFEATFYVDEAMVRDELARRGMFNMIHRSTFLKVDFIVRKDGAYDILAFERRRGVSIRGQTVAVISPEDLVLSKLVWARDSGSELQLRDVRNVLEMAPDLDGDYLAEWAQRLGVAALLAQLG